MALRTDQTTTPDAQLRQLYTEAAQHLGALPAEFGQLLLPTDQPLPPARRLVVLAPETLTDESTLVQRIWALAHARGLAVLYLGLVPRAQAEPAMRRRLALLAAQTRDNNGVKADFGLTVGGGWLARIRSVWQPGDVVVCHTAQQVRAGLSLRPLGLALSEALAAPVYVLNGLCAPEAAEWARAARGLLFWAGALVVVGAFLWLQASIQRLAEGWATSLLLVLSVMAEFGLLAAWNRRLQ